MTYSAGSADPGAQARETLMPTAHAAILQLWAAYQRLIELGWQPPPRAPSWGANFTALIVGCQSPIPVWWAGCIFLDGRGDEVHVVLVAPESA